MNIQPPIALRFHEVNLEQVRHARAGICPHCPKPIEGSTAATLAPKHIAGNLQFLQCTRCQVVVALEKA